MDRRDLSHRIRVSSSLSASGVVWTVSSDGDDHSVFAGAGARGRAVESALRLAEGLRLGGTVLVMVDPTDTGEKVTRVVRSRLAS
jgi:hypothetical protein